MRITANVVMIVGVLFVLDAALAYFWKEPVSTLQAHMAQGRLEASLDRAGTDEGRDPPVPDQQLVARIPRGGKDDIAARLASYARAYDRRASAGEAVGRISIPRIGLRRIVVAGTDHDDLAKGPGHYPATPLPGEAGTVGIAGHRTTYGAPFRNVDELRAGDRIVVTMPYGRFTYRIERTQIVAPTALWVTNKVSYDRLILSACHPKYSAAQRYIVFARLVDEVPLGPAA